RCIDFYTEILSGRLGNTYYKLMYELAMTKVLYIVMSGKEAEEKFDLALISATRMLENSMVEKVKLLFFGPSEILLAHASGERAQKIKKLIGMGAVDSACSGVAKEINVEAELKILGVNLERYSSRLVALLNEGYTPITF
ncbi:MAG: hypothetical protein QXU18_00450, partial [Thermoplasmatales archaeon]